MAFSDKWIGSLHLASAIVALICGTLVLYMNKGTARHRKAGYVYTFSMLIVIVTAFGIYRLFKGFGPFHAFAIVAIISLALGMIPMLKKQKTAKAIKTHYSRMYWSVIGLYAAFAAETLVRLPKAPFWEVVFISLAVLMMAAGFFFRKITNVWENRFAKQGDKKTV
jgi:uncharacterized membrane protein